MTRLDYQNICELASDGKDKMLENQKSHQVGKILSCNHGYFNVKVGQGWQVWSREICEEAAAGRSKSDPPYDFQI